MWLLYRWHVIQFDVVLTNRWSKQRQINYSNNSQFSEIHWPLNITELLRKGIHNASYLHLELIIQGNISWSNLDDMQVIENISSKIYGGSECRIYPHQLRKEGRSVFFSTRQIDSWTTKTLCITTLFNCACIKLSIKHEIELPNDIFELISAWFFSMISSLVFTHFSPHSTLQARLWFPFHLDLLLPQILYHNFILP